MNRPLETPNQNIEIDFSLAGKPGTTVTAQFYREVASHLPSARLGSKDRIQLSLEDQVIFKNCPLVVIEVYRKLMR